MFVPEDDYNLEQLWNNINPNQLMDASLNCTFEAPNEKINDKVRRLREENLKMFEENLDLKVICILKLIFHFKK